MVTSKKVMMILFSMVALLFLFSGCTPIEGTYDLRGGDGFSSARVFVPQGDGVTGAVTVSGGMGNTKEQMYWLAERLQEGGIIAMAISASNNMAVSGYQRAHEGGVEALAEENANSSSDIYGRVGKRGVMGYSMGGGAVINVGHEPDVDVVVAMAPFGPSPRTGYHAASMVLTGTADVIASPRMGKGAFDRMPSSTPRLYASMSGASHMKWMMNARPGSEADFIVAWAQYYLNGDESAYSVFSGGAGRGMTGYEFYPGDGSGGSGSGSSGGSGSEDPPGGCN